MTMRKKRSKRDIEKNYPKDQFVTKLRRLADCVEQGKRFRIQVAGESISIPPTAIINIEHERGSSEEEMEFQLNWQIKGKGKETLQQYSRTVNDVFELSKRVSTT